MLLSLKKFDGIITGALEAYCLVCMNYFKSKSELSTHMTTTEHKKNLESAPFHDQYKDESIRQVMAGFYCAFCNMLLPKVMLVDTHVTEMEHIYNRKLQTLKRIKGGVLAFKDIFISDSAWNGIREKWCSVCNIELRSLADVYIHMVEHIHTVNLIQSKIEFWGEYLYRKCAEVLHCLTCNVKISLDEGMHHFKTSEHIIKYDECSRKGKDILNIDVSNQVHTSKSKSDNILSDTDLNNPVMEGLTDNTSNHSDNSNYTNTNYIELEKEICNLMNVNYYIIDDIDPQHVRCIICDYIMVKQIVPFHLNQRHHVELVKFHKARLQKLSMDSNKLLKNHENVTNTKEEQSNAKILNSIVDFQKNKINIDFVSCTAVCKKCSSSLTFEFGSIISHIEEHKKQTEDHSKTFSPESPKASTSATVPNDNCRDEIGIYIEEHKLQKRINNIYCTICDVHLPEGFSNLKEHVNGVQHSLRTQRQQSANTQRNALRKINQADFVESFTFIGNSIGEFVLFNGNYCLTQNSFMTFAIENDPIIRCFACLTNFNKVDIQLHLFSFQHMSKFENMKVIADLDNEFVREGDHDVYHCGYCNIVQSGWSAMEDHLKSSEHEAKKTNSRYILSVLNQRIQEMEEDPVWV
ncbi:hypothetical protein ACJJTC_014181 [Scirpophaga incertulas]